MEYDPLAAPTLNTIDIASELGVFADAMDWDSAHWAALVAYIEDQLDYTGRSFGEMTVHDVHCAIWAKGPKGNHVSHVERLIGTEDRASHEVFRIARKLLRIYDLRMAELLKLFQVLQCCPGKVEDLSVKNLMALIDIVDDDAAPRYVLPPA
jgi:hypothetical protein